MAITADVNHSCGDCHDPNTSSWVARGGRFNVDEDKNGPHHPEGIRGRAADFNSRFGKEPRNPKDMHRPLADHENLDGAMCRKEFRTLSQALTLRYDKVLFILDPSVFAKRLAGKKVVVCDYPDGRLEIMEGSTSLPYRTFDKLRSVHRSEIVENKRLDEALAMVAEMQAGRELTRSQHGPRRTGQANHLFGIPAWSTDGFHERSRRDRPAGTGADEAGSCGMRCRDQIISDIAPMS